MKFATLPRILRQRLQTSTSQSTKSLRLPRETNRFRPSSNPPRLPTFLQPSRTPAPAVFCNVSKSLRLPRETHFEPQKTSRDRQFLTIWTSKSLSRAGVVQILRSSTSKSAPIIPRFNDFDFQIALARRRGANFVDVNFQKCSEPTVSHGVLTILTSESLSRAGVVQILPTSWAADPSQLPFFGPTFANLRSDKTMEKHSISRNSYPPKSLMSHICAVKHLYCPTSILRDLPATFSIVGS